MIRPLAVAIALVLILAGTALGQNRCSVFGGTVYAWHDGTAWVGEGDFSLARKVLHAKVRVVNTAVQKHGEMWWGKETASFDFGDGARLDLVTEFTTEHMNNKSGIFHVNQTGTMANGTGFLKKASGHFSAQGPFGPGVVLPSGVPKAPGAGLMYWIGHYDGTICW